MKRVMYAIAVSTLAGCVSVPQDPAALAAYLNNRGSVVDVSKSDGLLGWGSLDAPAAKAEATCKGQGGWPSRAMAEFQFGGQFTASRRLISSVTCKHKETGASWAMDFDYRGNTFVSTVVNPGTRTLDARYRVSYVDGSGVAQRESARDAERARADQFRLQQAEAAKQALKDRDEAERLRVSRIPSFRASLKPGDRFQTRGDVFGLTVTGLVVEVKPPLAFVQFDNMQPSTRWVEISTLEPR